MEVGWYTNDISNIVLIRSVPRVFNSTCYNQRSTKY